MSSFRAGQQALSILAISSTLRPTMGRILSPVGLMHGELATSAMVRLAALAAPMERRSQIPICSTLGIVRAVTWPSAMGTPNGLLRVPSPQEPTGTVASPTAMFKLPISASICGRLIKKEAICDGLPAAENKHELREKSHKKSRAEGAFWPFSIAPVACWRLFAQPNHHGSATARP